jgi:hypothetical protein
MKPPKITHIYKLKKISKKGEIEIRDLRDKFFMVDDAYINGYAKILGIYATGVYMSLCRHVAIGTQECFPRVQTIAEELGISARVVMRAIKALASWKLIIIEKRIGQSNLYTLTNKSSWAKKPIRDDRIRL